MYSSAQRIYTVHTRRMRHVNKGPCRYARMSKTYKCCNIGSLCRLLFAVRDIYVHMCCTCTAEGKLERRENEKYFHRNKLKFEIFQEMD